MHFNKSKSYLLSTSITGNYSENISCISAVNYFFCRGETSAIQAFSFGATSSIMIVAHIIANLISFVALLEFSNRTVEWFGIRAGVELTLKVSLLFTWKKSLSMFSKQQKLFFTGESLLYYSQSTVQNSAYTINITTSNDRSFICPTICLDTNSQCYFVH